MDTQDRADAKTAWRTYGSAMHSVPYYYNTETRASVWVMPRELAAALAEVDAEDASRRGAASSLVQTPTLTPKPSPNPNPHSHHNNPDPDPNKPKP